MKISGLRPGLLFGAIVLLWSVYNPEPALAHGFAGDRFFPATISTDDPFAASELSLPTISYSRQPGSPATKTINFSSDLSLLVLPYVAVTLGRGYQWQKADGQSAQTGFNNFAANVLYEFFENDEHEAIMSVGLTTEFGGTGSRSIGSSSFSTLTPIFYFGKGLGDLPTNLRMCSNGGSQLIQSHLSAGTRERHRTESTVRPDDSVGRILHVNAG